MCKYKDENWWGRQPQTDTKHKQPARSSMQPATCTTTSTHQQQTTERSTSLTSRVRKVTKDRRELPHVATMQQKCHEPRTSFSPNADTALLAIEELLDWRDGINSRKKNLRHKKAHNTMEVSPSTLVVCAFFAPKAVSLAMWPRQPNSLVILYFLSLDKHSQ